MIGTSHPLHTNTRFTSHLYNVFKSLQPWLVVILVCPYSTGTSLSGKFGEKKVLVFDILLCNDWDLSSTSYLYQSTSYIKRCLTYSVCGGQSYECVLTPPIAMAKFGVWQLAGSGIRMVMVLIVGCKL